MDKLAARVRCTVTSPRHSGTSTLQNRAFRVAFETLYLPSGPRGVPSGIGTEREVLAVAKERLGCSKCSKYFISSH